MAAKRRPYIGAIKPYTWDLRDGEQVPGLLLGGAIGVAAHVTKAEAYELADRLVDAADSLPDDPQQPGVQQVPQPCYSTRSDTLTAADGTEEEPLHSTPADDAEAPRARPVLRRIVEPPAEPQTPPAAPRVRVIRRLDTRPKGLPWKR